MKAVVVSHTYITRLNRRKLQALGRLNDQINISVIVPRTWIPGGVQADRVISTSGPDDGVDMLALPNLSQSNQGMLTFGYELVDFLKKFRPDIIQVEQGSKSLAYAQCIMLNKLLGLKAKNVFFTWWNLPYSPSIPVALLEQFNLQNTDGLIAGNSDAAEILQHHGYAGPSVVLPQLGVDEILFDDLPTNARAELGLTADDFVVGFAGRLVKEKGILTLLKAFQSFIQAREETADNIKLLFVGRGPLKDEVTKVAAQCKSKILLAEDVPHEKMPHFLRAMSVMVLPSEYLDEDFTLTARGWKEQFGHVLIEAMACRVPVIGSNSGEIPRVIDDAGMVFPEGNADSLARWLAELYENHGLREKYATAGRARVLSHYTDDVLAKKQYDFWCSLQER